MGVIQRVVITLLVMVATATTTMATGSSEVVVSEGGALLHCDSMSHDFGVIDRRVEDVWHTFTVENRGDEPLIIKRVDRSCSCMRVSFSRRPIAPGDSRDMRVIYEVRKMPEGLFSKVVQIYSNSRDAGFTQFTITGRSISVKKRQ